MIRILSVMLIGLMAVVQVQAADEAVPPVTGPAPVPVPVPKAKAGEVFGDWSKRCEKPAEGQEICYIVQTASNKETGQMMMQVRIGYPPGQAEPIMIVTVPLGALLPPGIALYMTDKELLKLPFLACGREGCTTVGQKIGKDVIDKMRKGNTAQVRVMLLTRQVIPLPVSLKGFTRAFNAVKPKK